MSALSQSTTVLALDEARICGSSPDHDTDGRLAGEIRQLSVVNDNFLGVRQVISIKRWTPRATTHCGRFDLAPLLQMPSMRRHIISIQASWTKPWSWLLGPGEQ